MLTYAGLRGFPVSVFSSFCSERRRDIFLLRMSACIARAKKALPIRVPDVVLPVVITSVTNMPAQIEPETAALVLRVELARGSSSGGIFSGFDLSISSKVIRPHNPSVSS